MDIITTISEKTVSAIIKSDVINKEFTKEDFLYIENIIKKYRHKDIKITDEHIKQLAENGAMILYSELFKYIIVLLIAYLLNIFLPTFLIMNTFSVLRSFAGGNHMSTFNKCFAVMIISFLSLGLFVSKVDINIIYIIVSYMLSLIFAWRYAPQEREDKSDKDCDNGDRFKKITMVFITVGFLVTVMFHYLNYTIIDNSIALGVFLEMMTVTPLGIKFFTWLDNGGN